MYFQSKKEKVSITIEFAIFETVHVPSFSLNSQFWLFRPNLSKNDISSAKQKQV